MEQTMTASVMMTDGQIENAVSKLRDALRKHREEITSEAAQLALGVDNIGMKMFAPFRQQVEAVSNIVVRRVKVNRSRTPQEMLAATGRAQYIDREVVNAMPRGEGEEVEIEFFKLDLTARNGCISDDDLEKELASLGYSRSADPYELAAVNEADPAFADNHPNGTHWKDSDGNWCYIAFGRWHDERFVSVGRSDRVWIGYWWFAGARK